MNTDTNIDCEDYDDVSDEIWDGIEVWFQPPNDHSLETATKVFRDALDQLNLHYIEVPEILIEVGKNGSEVWHFDLDSYLFQENPEENIPALINLVSKSGVLPGFSYNCYAE